MKYFLLVRAGWPTRLSFHRGGEVLCLMVLFGSDLHYLSLQLAEADLSCNVLKFPQLMRLASPQTQDTVMKSQEFPSLLHFVKVMISGTLSKGKR